MAIALVFDLDGTLAETRKDIAASANVALAAMGLQPIPVDVVTTYVGEGAGKLIERCLGPRQDLHAATLAAWTKHYTDHLLDTSVLYPGVEETLRKLPGPLAVLSNKPEGMTRRMIAGLGIAGRFEVVIGGDSLPTRKPDPAGLNKIRETLRCDSAILVGDTAIDVATAKAAGMKCWGAAYGFAGRMPLESAGADAIFYLFEELIALRKDLR